MSSQVLKFKKNHNRLGRAVRDAGGTLSLPHISVRIFFPLFFCMNIVIRVWKKKQTLGKTGISTYED